jgi:hypothetical protein
MRKLSNLQVFKALLAVSGLAATAFLAGCADNSSNKSSPLEKPLSQQARIEANLKKVFPSYDLRDGKNMNLAGRLVGASAAAQKAAQAQPGEKSVYTVQVQALIRGLGSDEIIAVTSRGQLESPAPGTLRNDVTCSSPEVAGRFAVQAACHGENCSLLIVRILERLTDENSGRRLETMAEQKLEAASQPQEISMERAGESIRQTVLVFKRQLSRDSSGREAAPLALEWSASANPRNFFGGLKTSYAKAIESRSNQSNLRGKISLEPHQTAEGSECLAIEPQQTPATPQQAGQPTAPEAAVPEATSPEATSPEATSPEAPGQPSVPQAPSVGSVPAES